MDQRKDTALLEAFAEVPDPRKRREHPYPLDLPTDAGECDAGKWATARKRRRTVSRGAR